MRITEDNGEISVRFRILRLKTDPVFGCTDKETIRSSGRGCTSSGIRGHLASPWAACGVRQWSSHNRIETIIKINIQNDACRVCELTERMPGLQESYFLRQKSEINPRLIPWHILAYRLRRIRGLTTFALNLFERDARSATLSVASSATLSDTRLRIWFQVRFREQSDERFSA